MDPITSSCHEIGEWLKPIAARFAKQSLPATSVRSVTGNIPSEADRSSRSSDEIDISAGLCGDRFGGYSRCGCPTIVVSIGIGSSWNALGASWNIGHFGRRWRGGLGSCALDGTHEKTPRLGYGEKALRLKGSIGTNRCRTNDYIH